MPKHRILTKEEIANLPPRSKPAPKATDWQETLDDIASGETVAIPVESPTQRKGFRIGLSRVARHRMGMKVGYLDVGDELVAFKIEEQDEEQTEEARTTSKRKPAKKSEE